MRQAAAVGGQRRPHHRNAGQEDHRGSTGGRTRSSSSVPTGNEITRGLSRRENLSLGPDFAPKLRSCIAINQHAQMTVLTFLGWSRERAHGRSATLRRQLTMQARILANSQPHWSCLKKASQVENLGEAVLPAQHRQTVRRCCSARNDLEWPSVFSATNWPSRTCHAHTHAHGRGCSAVEHSLGAAATCTRRRPWRHSPRESGARHRLGAAGPARRLARIGAYCWIATRRPTARHRPTTQCWLATRWSATHCWPATWRRLTTCRFTTWCRFTARCWLQSITCSGPCAWSGAVTRTDTVADARARAKPQLDRRSGS